MTDKISDLYKLDPISAVWSREGFSGIDYSDGDETELYIKNSIASAEQVDVFSESLRDKCVDWPSLYHLSPIRSNLLRPFSEFLRGKSILEIGSGCGAITRYLGELNAEVLALEGSPRRAAITRSRTRDLPNVDVIADSFSNFTCSEKFDVVTLIGVLEYAALFTDSAHPAKTMLQKVSSFLKPGGTLIIAIENKLGLKYFAGASEDHLGIPMYGIESLYTDRQVRTYGKLELTDLLEQTGYRSIDFFLPFPDYKLPRSIISPIGAKHPGFDASALAAQSGNKDTQLPSLRCFSTELAWKGLFSNGVASDFSNSFLILSQTPGGDDTSELNQPGILAWHFSSDRRPQFCKETVFVEDMEGNIHVQSQPLLPMVVAAAEPIESVRQVLVERVRYSNGPTLHHEIQSLLARHGWSLKDLGSLLSPYLEILKSHIIDPAASSELNPSELMLPGKFIDCIPQNIISFNPSSSELFDQEWQVTTPVSLERILIRAALSVVGSSSRVSRCADMHVETPHHFIDAFFAALGLTCDPNRLIAHIHDEQDFQFSVTGQRQDTHELLNWLENRPLEKDSAIRAHAMLDAAAREQAKEISDLKVSLQKQSGEISTLSGAVNETSQQLAAAKELFESENLRHTDVVRQLTSQLQETEQLLRRSTTDLKAASEQFDSLINSTSWKLTRPLRRIMGLLR